MDLANIIRYETPVALDLIDPTTREKVGVTFYVKHVDCEAATEAKGRQEDSALLAALSDKPTPAGDSNKQILAACIDSWDWGEHTFQGEVPVLSMEKAVEVFKAAPWIQAAVLKKVTVIANFTGASKTD